MFASKGNKVIKAPKGFMGYIFFSFSLVSIQFKVIDIIQNLFLTANPPIFCNKMNLEQFAFSPF